MIVRQASSGGVICIPQSQHAAVSGQIARAWGNLSFPVPQPQYAVCLAAERHDDGMDPFDERPERDPETGLPRDFMSMPLDLWLECWRRGPRLVGEDSAYAGLLVSMHGEHLLGYREIDEDDEEAVDAVERFRSEQAELREELREQASEIDECRPHLSDEALECNRRLLAVWDAMSLAICMPRLPGSFESVPAERHSEELAINSIGALGAGQDLLEVEPWPFSGDGVPIAVAGRRLEGRFDDQDSLDAALEDASLETLSLKLCRREEDEDSGGGGMPAEMPL